MYFVQTVYTSHNLEPQTAYKRRANSLRNATGGEGESGLKVYQRRGGADEAGGVKEEFVSCCCSSRELLLHLQVQVCEEEGKLFY